MKALFTNEVPYKIKGILVRDGRESILAYKEKETKGSDSKTFIHTTIS